MHPAFRIVIDTNVFISALVFGGKPRQILTLLARSDIVVVVSEEIFSELRRKVAQKFPDFVHETAALIDLLTQDADVVKLGSITITACRDVDDNRILETAILGGCSYIVTGDKDLLTLGSYQNVQIVQPADFLDIFAH